MENRKTKATVKIVKAGDTNKCKIYLALGNKESYDGLIVLNDNSMGNMTHVYENTYDVDYFKNRLTDPQVKNLSLNGELYLDVNKSIIVDKNEALYEANVNDKKVKFPIVLFNVDIRASGNISRKFRAVKYGKLTTDEAYGRIPKKASSETTPNVVSAGLASVVSAQEAVIAFAFNNYGGVNIDGVNYSKPMGMDLTGK